MVNILINQLRIVFRTNKAQALCVWLNLVFSQKTRFSQKPSLVIHLEFGENFNQSIKGCIPLSVKYLEFYQKFKKFKIKHVPKNMEKLKFRFAKNKNRL